MMYQWRAPFVLDDSAFRARFRAAPTALEPPSPRTIAPARATYAAPSRAAA